MSGIKLGLVKVPFTINYTIPNFDLFETAVSEEHNIKNGDIVLNLTVTPYKFKLHLQLQRVSQIPDEVDICNCSDGIVNFNGCLERLTSMTSGTFISTDTDDNLCIATLDGGIGTRKLNLELLNNSSADKSLRVQVSGFAYYQKSGEGLSEDLKSLVNNPDSSDIKFQVGDSVFYDHSCILIARSPVFKNILSVECSESSERWLRIDDIEPETFKEFLHFLYTDTCPNLSNKGQGLLILATKYDVSSLKEICESLLPAVVTVNVNNVCDYLFGSCEIKTENDLNLLLTCTSNCIELVIETDGWKVRKEEAQGVHLILMNLIERIAKRVATD